MKQDQNKNHRNEMNKDSRKDHKKRNIWIASIAGIIVLAVIIILICVLWNRKDKKDTAAEPENQGMLNWDDRIADLENEPVSDMDVVYKDKNVGSDKPYLINVNKAQNCIIVYKKDKNGKYTEPQRAMICSVGYDTPTGDFTTSDKYEWKIVNGNMWAQYATRVVGNVLFHSMPYASNTKDSLLAQYYNQLGSTLSASCIRLSARDAQWIMQNCPAGTKVKIYESEKEEPLSRPKAMRVPEDAVWDPTDPDAANPYQSVQIAFEGLESQRVVERGTQINYVKGVTVKDTCGNDIASEVQVSTKLDPFQLGSYEVNYSVEDAAGKTAQATVLYQVVDTTPPQFSGLKSVMNFDAVSDVTKENILKGVTVIDNNEILDNSRVSVVIPTIVEGSNTITLSVTDDYNNTTTTSMTVSIHVKPPVIALKPGMETIIPLTQKVDQAYALSRVTATKDGATMAQDRISVSITPTEWGYFFRYTATDENGYVGILEDSVTYVEYRITLPKNQTITDINDKNQLLKSVVIRNNLGGSLENSVINVTTTKLAGDKYQADYSYTYTSPRGTKVATATTVFSLQGAASDATPAPDATQQPGEEEGTGGEDEPQTSEPPTGQETVE